MLARQCQDVHMQTDREIIVEHEYVGIDTIHLNQYIYGQKSDWLYTYIDNTPLLSLPITSLYSRLKAGTVYMKPEMCTLLNKKAGTYHESSA